ncbi:MAG: hypothetical protein AB7V43_00085 [Acidimicrobiia bacterium]
MTNVVGETDSALIWVRKHADAVVNVGVLAACTLLMLRVLHPSLLFDDTTPTGGDMGAHVWAPAYLRDHLLPNWRLSGWAPSWYAGFPLYEFYMVIPPLLIVILDVLLPYNVAFKLVSVSGLLTLPLAAWAMGRLARLPHPLPAMLAIGTLPFLFDRGFSIYGGNIASTMAGEFNFSVALSLCLLYIGLLIRACSEQRGRAITAVVLALTVLSHLLVGFFAVAATIVVIAVYSYRNLTGLKYVWPAPVVALAISGFWTVPFVVNRHHTIDMGWMKLTDYWHQLLAPRMVWALMLAVLAVVKLLRDRQRALLAILLWTIVMGLVFRFLPATDDGHSERLWNARMVQFAWLGIYLMAAIGAVELVHQITVATRWNRPKLVAALTPTIAGIICIIYVGLPMGALGLTGRTNNSGDSEHWFGLSAKTSYLAPWIEQNYRGYERRSQWPEYKAINDTMADLGVKRGCGRAMWEYDSDRLGGYGTPLSMMLLPYWTDGCIDSMEGLYFESSPTTPFHFLMAAEVTQKPSNPVTFPDPSVYRSLDLTHGIEHMQLYGIKYYMALSPEAIAQADQRSELTRVATSDPWVVYELSGSDLVVGIDRMPYVEPGSGSTWERWRDTGLATWDLLNDHRYYAATDGPANWPRIRRGDPVPNMVIDSPAVVSNIVSTEDSISFDVDQVGKPVLVKINYFPNWNADGADGPYRVTPNLMIVVPTSSSVRLQYGRTSADIVGTAASVLGIAAAITISLADRRRTPMRVPLTPPAIALPRVPAAWTPRNGTMVSDDSWLTSDTWASRPDPWSSPPDRAPDTDGRWLPTGEIPVTDIAPSTHIDDFAPMVEEPSTSQRPIDERSDRQEPSTLEGPSHDWPLQPPEPPSDPGGQRG